MAEVFSYTKAKIDELLANHTHLAGAISNFTEAVQDVIGALFVSAGGTYDDVNNTVAFQGATTSARGMVKLANHLGGTADLPTVRSASTTQTGISELATDTETVTGTDAVRVTTPAGVAAALVNRVRSTTVLDIWSGTQAEYDAINPKVATTLYFIKAP